jgi:predicted transglutaminase-like cysteine proteinase
LVFQVPVDAFAHLRAALSCAKVVGSAVIMLAIFPGLSEAPLPAADDAWPKWRAVCNRLPLPGQTLPPCQPNWPSIAAMNKAINDLIVYTADRGDGWQAVDETLRLLTGDCEDFAIAKYVSLKLAGITDVCLVLAEIAAMPQNLPHAFLVVELNGEHRVLDNMFNQLIEPKDYINLQPKKAFFAAEAVMFARPVVLADLR